MRADAEQFKDWHVNKIKQWKEVEKV